MPMLMLSLNSCDNFEDQFEINQEEFKAEQAIEEAKEKEPIKQNPDLSFTFNKNFLEVTFTKTTEAFNLEWNFGDGNTSTEKNPIHTYAEEGKYIVSLKGTSVDDVTSTVEVEVNVVAVIPDPVSNFTNEITDLEVVFTNTSKNATTYIWDFGDNRSSTNENPKHTYLDSGTFTVTLTASSDDLSKDPDVFTKEITVIKPKPKGPEIFNNTFAKIPRIDGSTGSDCACSGWVNKDLGDQAESSSSNGSSLKLDGRESDLAYQEITVAANTDYELAFLYRFKEEKQNSKLDNFDFENPSQLEVRILKGGGYIDIKEVEKATNNLLVDTLDPVSSYINNTSPIFNSGANTTITIVIRGIGRPNTPPRDGKGPPYQWSNADHEINIDDIELIVK